MDLENMMLSETSQSEKDKYHMISLTCGIWGTSWTKKENGDRLIDGEQAASWGGGRWGVEELSKKEKGLMDMDNSVMISRGNYKGTKW